MKRHRETNEDRHKRLLVVDDESNLRHMLSSLLGRSRYRVETAVDGADALVMVGKKKYDFILCDLKMPNMGGMEFLRAASDQIMDSTVIMMSAYGSIDLAIETLKNGAYDFISKPFKADEVLMTLKKAEERERLKNENRLLKEKIENIHKHYSFGRMVGKSDVLHPVFGLAEKAARFDTTVLITGESGTGKELMAQGIHKLGNRSKRAMIPVNCGGIPENLLESELFGHTRGAFTGADRNKKGLFEEADKGTIFLDEIGELPFTLQVKLLRALQEGEIRAVGDSKYKKIDVRVIAATAKKLEHEVSKGTFREDLFYRLNVLRIEMPPLRDWIEDIPILVQHFLDIYNTKFGRDIRGVTPEAIRLLKNYSWPGNVRELENVIERAVVLAEDTLLQPDGLPEALQARSTNDSTDDFFDGLSIKSAQQKMEKLLIERALSATAGNRTKAGKLLEISHPSLLSKIKTYGIEK